MELIGGIILYFKGVMRALHLYKFLMIRDVDNFDKITQSDFYTKQLQGIKVNDKGHKCSVLGPFCNGELKDQAIKPQFKLNKARIDNLIGRSEEIQQVYENLINDRFVTIFGYPGLGKSTIA